MRWRPRFRPASAKHHQRGLVRASPGTSALALSLGETRPPRITTPRTPLRLFAGFFARPVLGVPGSRPWFRSRPFVPPSCQTASHASSDGLMAFACIRVHERSRLREIELCAASNDTMQMLRICAAAAIRTRSWAYRTRRAHQLNLNC